MADPKFIDAVLLGATSPPGTVLLNARVALLVPRMVAALRQLEWSGVPNSKHAFDFQLYECPMCNAPANWVAGMHPAGTAQPDYIRRHRSGCELGTLLAEIDASKAGG